MYLQMHILHKCLQSCVKTKKRERERETDVFTGLESKSLTKITYTIPAHGI